MRQEKIIENLVRFARDEAAGLKRVRTLKRISKIGSWTVLVVSFTCAFQDPPPVPEWIPTFAAAMGGGMIGLGIWFAHTLRTWPTLRQFVDLKRLKIYDKKIVAGRVRNLQWEPGCETMAGNPREPA